MKKLFKLFSCFLIFSIVFSFSALAKTVENIVYQVTAEDLYNLLSSGIYDSYIDNYYLENGVLYAHVKSGNFGLITSPTGTGVLNFPYLQNGTEYHLNVVGSNVNVYYRNFKSKSVYPNSSEFVGTDIRQPGFLLSDSSNFFSFKVFTLEEVPDDPGDGGSSGSLGSPNDLTEIATPFVSNCVSMTWEAVKSCWWAMAFLMLPFVYLIFVVLSNIFVNRRVKLSGYGAFKFSKSFRYRIDEGRRKRFADKYMKDRDDLEFIKIDGKKYYNSNKKLHGHFVTEYKHRRGTSYHYFNDKEKQLDENEE